MARDGQDQTTPPTPASRSGQVTARLATLALLALGATALTSLGLARWLGATADQPTPVTPGRPAAPLFQNWPAGRAPDIVFVFTGQRHGYIKFCGCSSPQLGGLERLYNFLEQLRGRGWPVVPVDLGDIPVQKGLHDQIELKYATTMRAYEKMGYAAVGVGLEEVKMPLLNALALFTLQQPVPSPRVLFANLLDRPQNFPGQTGGSMLDEYALVAGPNHPTVGIVGIAGKTVSEAMAKQQDPTIKFAEDNGKVLKDVLNRMDQAKTQPQIRILLYQGVDQGPGQGVQAAAQQFPQFQVILHSDDRDEPSAVPQRIKHTNGGETLLIAVGHKARFAGVLGGFKNARGGYDFYYELVELRPELETPAGQEANHPILAILDDYSRTINNKDYISRITPVPHPAQVALGGGNPAAPSPTYLGSQRCQPCHVAEYQKWKDSKHSHAYEGLASAKKPAGRQFDPECIGCHSVGYGYLTGYVNERQTPHLKDVGCESCHGPGSLHVQQPQNPNYLAELSPWKKTRPVQKTDRLPAPEALQRGGPFPQNEKDLVERVADTCHKCHDTDNDPGFKFELFWPKVVHSNLPQQQPAPGP